MQKCSQYGCGKFVHRACEERFLLDLKVEVGIDPGIFCQGCLLQFRKTYFESIPDPSLGTSVQHFMAEKHTTINSPPLPSIAVQHYLVEVPGAASSDEVSSAAPTNVAPTLTDFVPPADIQLHVVPAAIIGNAQKSLCTLRQEYNSETKLRKQKGFSKCCGVFDPRIFRYMDILYKNIDLSMCQFSEEDGPFAFGKIIEVPNKKCDRITYTLLYDPAYCVDVETYKNYTTIIPADKHLKKLLKEGIARADILQYRFFENNTTVRDAPIISRNVLIAGLLEQQQKNMLNLRS